LTSNHFLVKQKNLRPPHALVDEEEHRHLSRVLRMAPGEKVWLVDEQGSSYRAEVEEVGRRQTRLLILEKKEASAGKLRLVLAQALIKSKNMELVIQKATELGVWVIIPVEAVRSVVKLNEKEAGKLERWRKIAAEAVKQSRRSDIPFIQKPQPYPSFLQARDEPRRLILCEDGGVILREILVAGPAGQGVPEVSTVIVLVGPEGGWTKKEQEQAFEKGFEAVSLGSRILRSETAALAILAAISIFWGD
jgi:16S rRNA (uracil1498-N3)-methyltransferase